jgi:hypothetical protein
MRGIKSTSRSLLRRALSAASSAPPTRYGLTVLSHNDTTLGQGGALSVGKEFMRPENTAGVLTLAAVAESDARGTTFDGVEDDALMGLTLDVLKRHGALPAEVVWDEDGARANAADAHFRPSKVVKGALVQLEVDALMAGGFVGSWHNDGLVHQSETNCGPGSLWGVVQDVVKTTTKKTMNGEEEEEDEKEEVVVQSVDVLIVDAPYRNRDMEDPEASGLELVQTIDTPDELLLKTGAGGGAPAPPLPRGPPSAPDVSTGLGVAYVCRVSSGAAGGGSTRSSSNSNTDNLARRLKVYSGLETSYLGEHLRLARNRVALCWPEPLALADVEFKVLRAKGGPPTLEPLTEAQLATKNFGAILASGEVKVFVKGEEVNVHDPTFVVPPPSARQQQHVIYASGAASVAASIVLIKGTGMGVFAALIPFGLSLAAAGSRWLAIWRFLPPPLGPKRKEVKL